MPRLILKRPSKWQDAMRSYKIYIDGKKIGQIQDDETKEFDILPGQHTIKAKIDFLWSKPVRFKIKNDETKQILVKNNTSLWVPALIGVLGAYFGKIIYKSFFQSIEYIQFFVILIMIIFILWSYNKITPYLKLEILEEK